MKNNKTFVIISVLSVILIGFFVIYIMNEKNSIIKNGKDFEAKCIDVYTRKSSRRSNLGNHNGSKRVYVFEVVYPSNIKGKQFKKTSKRYTIGRTYKGKYIDNGEKHNILKNRYEYQIIEY